MNANGSRPTPGATVAQLRTAIDRGETADKVAHADHAAAPLGTDEEAAGTPTDPALTEANLRHERQPPAAGRPSRDFAVMVTLAVGLVMLAAVAVAAFTRGIL